MSTSTPQSVQAPQGVQDMFLKHISDTKTPVTVFLRNGVKLQGLIVQFDGTSLVLRRDSHTQLVYKHAVMTIMPSSPISLSDSEDELVWT